MMVEPWLTSKEAGAMLVALCHVRNKMTPEEVGLTPAEFLHIVTGIESLSDAMEEAEHEFSD